jgi:hypothetical protein
VALSARSDAIAIHIASNQPTYLAKVGVTGSSPASRSGYYKRPPEARTRHIEWLWLRFCIPPSRARDGSYQPVALPQGYAKGYGSLLGWSLNGEARIVATPPAARATWSKTAATSTRLDAYRSAGAVNERPGAMKRPYMSRMAARRGGWAEGGPRSSRGLSPADAGRRSRGVPVWQTYP